MNQLNPAMVKQTNELYELAGQELMEAAKNRQLPPKFPFIMKLYWQRRSNLTPPKTEASMILIGSRGMNAVAEFILGSVSSKVAMYAEIPVLIVK
ncbi:MAG: universal stress protein [Phascolarctobacterium faecium]